MRKTGLLLTLFGLLAVVSFAPTSAQAQATRTWVSGTGDDANPCSRTAPCKTFGGAISKTAAGGEIDCMDPGGFGAVTIVKSMTIDCGTLAGGILNSGGVNGIIVNAGVNDKVVLRNVVIQGTVGVSGLNGIRFLAGRELHLDRVVVQGQSNFCLDVNKTTLGIIHIQNSYFTECLGGINISSTSFLIADIENSIFAGIPGNGIAAATANAFVHVTRSGFSDMGTCMVASASGASVDSVDNTLSNCGTFGMSASASGANITATRTTVLNPGTAFNVAAGATFLSGNDNKVAPVASAGANSTGAMAVR